MDEVGKSPSNQDTMETVYRLRLFVAGNEPNSFKARRVLEEVCRRRLAGRCDLEVVDVLVNYQAALDAGVMAVPVLMIEAPPPRRMIAGSLGDVQKLVRALGTDCGQ